MKMQSRHVLNYLIVPVTLLLLLTAAGCRRGTSSDDPHGGVAYLSAVIADGVGGADAPLRAQTQHSINHDLQDFEDRVTQLAVFVFPSGQPGRTAYYYIENISSSPNGHRIPPLQVTTGLNDIYFIANIGVVSVRDRLSSIQTRSQLESFLSEMKSYTGQGFLSRPYFQVGSRDIGLPMSRVYKGIMIPDGHHTKETAFEFRPTNHTMEPVTDGRDDLQGQIGLIRAVSKVTLTFKGVNLKDLSSFYLKGIPKRFSFMKQTSPTISTYDYTERAEVLVYGSGSSQYIKLTPENGEVSFVYYIPEGLVSSGAVQWHEPTNVVHTNYDTDLHGITTVQIKKLSSAEFFVPLIHATDAELGNHKYVDYAKGKVAGKTPDYSLKRNRHYHLTITVPDDPSDDLDVKYQQQPWDRLESTKDFTSVQVSNNSMVTESANPGVVKRDANLLLLNQAKFPPDGKGSVALDFTISQPAGALWNFSIDNAIDFDIKVYEQGSNQPLPTTSGTVKDSSTPSRLRVVVSALKPLTGAARYTELYLTINGREVQIVRDWMNNAEMSAAGPNRRYRIIQTQIL